VTSDTIKVGLITALTGVTSSNEVDTPDGAMARIAAQNAAGGVNGRKIVMVTEDDQSTVAGDATAARVLVEQKGVFAVMGYSSFLFASTKYLQQKGVPVTGTAFDGPEWGMEPYSNMFSANPPASTPYNGVRYTWDSTGKFFKQVGVTSLGGFAYGISPSATNAIKGTFAASAPSGVTECYANYSVPFGTVDFTADALALKSKGCNGAVTAFVDSSDLAFATSVRQTNNPVKILNYTGYDQQTLSTNATRQAYNGVYFASQVLFDKKNPAIATMYANMEKYIPHFNSNTIPDFGLFGGYLTADLMIKGLQMAGSSPTRQSFINNLRPVKDYNAGGLLPSATPFSPFGTPEMLPETYCEYYIQLQGDNFVSVGPGGAAICGNKVPFKGFS
jgi:branched-chain amino acid transport system substrate-binding protein